MTSLPLSIRNLTSTSLILKVLERFESARPKDGRRFNITEAFTGLVSNATQPTSLQLAAKSEGFSHEETSLTIGPFETQRTSMIPNPEEVLRLTFDVNGQRYRVDIPPPSHKSTTLTPLSPDPRFELTAVYILESSHLSLFSSAKLASWMSQLKNEFPLSALSIPGTHNSSTHYTALPSVRCQAVNIKTQLENGIRFLDIRVQPENPGDISKDGLILVHSAFPISLTGNKYFRDLLSIVYAFLETHPSETIVLSLKREGVGRATDQHLSKILHNYYADERWFTDNRIPTLGEARSKVVLIRRFAIDDSLKGKNSGRGWAIDAESWPDNCADGSCSSGEIRVQDFYEVAEARNISKKIQYSTDQLARAAKSVCILPEDMVIASAEAAKQPFFMNFLSASNFFSPSCWPDRIAAKLNPHIVTYLCQEHNHSTNVGDGSTGIVVCDWVGQNNDWDLIRCIVGMNTRLLTR